MARRPPPQVGVGGLHDDAVRVGPVVAQALPHAAGALGDVSPVATPVVHLEVLVGAVAEQLRAAGPEVGEPGNELLGRRGGGLVEVDGGHDLLLSGDGWSLSAVTVARQAARRARGRPWSALGDPWSGGRSREPGS